MEDLQLLLATHGLLIVAIAVLVDQAGIPIPAPPVLVLAGGLVGAGELGAGSTLTAATLACLPADLAWFEIGRARGRSVLRLLCRISLEPDSCVRTTSDSFARRGPATLLFSKFVPGLQTIAPPLAGASGMSRLRFLAFDLPGAAIWAASFLAAGALLADQIQTVLAALADVGGQVALLAILALVGWILWKGWNRQRFLRALRTARIEPGTLYEMIDGEPSPLIFDLRNADQLESDGARIPGARMLRADQLSTRHEEIPRDREIVVYCT
jgi:membrane protein DedA with SNARE-associated domain